MAAEVKLPRLGQGMESGTIVRWLKAEGEAVAKGEPLYELDTDKVTQEVEAESDGVLLKIVVADGEVDVGETVGIIGAQGEDVAALLAEAPEWERRCPDGDGAPASQPDAADAPSDPASQIETTRVPRRERRAKRVKASPLARRIARERGSIWADRGHRSGGPRDRRGRGEGSCRPGVERNSRGAGDRDRRAHVNSQDDRARALPRPGPRRSSSSRSPRTRPNSWRRASAWSS